MNKSTLLLILSIFSIIRAELFIRPIVGISNSFESSYLKWVVGPSAELQFGKSLRLPICFYGSVSLNSWFPSKQSISNTEEKSIDRNGGGIAYTTAIYSQLSNISSSAPPFAFFGIGYTRIHVNASLDVLNEGIKVSGIGSERNESAFTYIFGAGLRFETIELSGSLKCFSKSTKNPNLYSLSIGMPIVLKH